MNKKISPLVSIAVPCFNHENFVKETIQSIINQDYGNIELIIIDDGSTDNSANNIQDMIEVCKKRFQRFEFRSRPNKGLSTTLNEALDWSKGLYFSTLASDDLITPTKISLQVRHLEKHPNLSGVFGGIILFGNNNQDKIIVKNKEEYSFNDIFLHNFHLPAPTQLLRLEKIKKIRYREDIVIEDWYMWLKLTSNGSNLGYLKLPLALYRRHEGNFSNNSDKINNGRIQVLSEYRNCNLYSYSLAIVGLIRSDESRGVLRFVYIIKSIALYPSLIFSIRLYKSLIKALLSIRAY